MPNNCRRFQHCDPRTHRWTGGTPGLAPTFIPPPSGGTGAGSGASLHRPLAPRPASPRYRQRPEADANIIVGATFDESLDGVVRVAVVATGIDNTDAARQTQSTALTELAGNLRNDSRRIAGSTERRAPLSQFERPPQRPTTRHPEGRPATPASEYSHNAAPQGLDAYGRSSPVRAGHQHHRDRDDLNAQDFGLKSQDRAGPFVQQSNRVRAEGDIGMIDAKPRRRFILTKHVMAGIPVLVQQGMNAEAIAARLGCKVGTLKVRCSQAGISLRVPKEVNVVAMVPLAPASEAPKQPKQKRSYAFAVPTTLQLNKVTISQLRQRAEAIGMTEAELVTKLLEVIAQDDLFDAVLDNGKGAA